MNYNYRFGKMVDGELLFAPRILKNENNENFVTNDPKAYFEHGYKEILSTEPPKKEGLYYTQNFIEHEKAIITEWVEHEKEEVSTEEALTEILEVLE